MTLQLTTLARVKALLVQSLTTDDTAIGQLISMVSRQAEAVMQRECLLAARTVTLNVFPGQTQFRLAGVPVASIASVNWDPNRLFTGTAIPSTSYVWDSQAQLLSIDYQLPGGTQTLQVTYTGGMATTADLLVADTTYGDLVGAIEMQVAFYVKRRSDMTVKASSMNGSTLTMERVDWLPAVQEILDLYTLRSFV